jgi:hypothetical protein
MILDLDSGAVDLLEGNLVLTPCVGKNCLVWDFVVVVEI